MILQFDKYKLDIPLYCHEILCNKYEDLEADRRKLKKAIGIDLKMSAEDIAEKQKAGELNELSNADYSEHLLAICSNVCKGLEHLVFFLEKDKERDLIKEGFRIRIGDEIQLSIERVYAHLLNMFQAYQPKVKNFDEYVLDWYDTNPDGKGRRKQQYILNANSFNKVIAGNGFTSGEMIETMELERSIGKKIVETMDLDGNLSFTLSISQIAIFLRPKGISLPAKPRARKMFIRKYQKIFSTIPLNVKFDIGFFLTSSFKNYAMTEIINTSSRKESQPILVKVKK